MEFKKSIILLHITSEIAENALNYEIGLWLDIKDILPLFDLFNGRLCKSLWEGFLVHLLITELTWEDTDGMCTSIVWCLVLHYISIIFFWLGWWCFWLNCWMEKICIWEGFRGCFQTCAWLPFPFFGLFMSLNLFADNRKWI